MTDANSPNLTRRGLLGGSLAAVTGASLALAAPEAAASTPASVPKVEPFWGSHQSGILTPQQTHIYFVALDLVAKTRDELISLLKIWTAASNRMSKGETAAALTTDLEAEPVDSAETVGLSPARLTITFGFGPGMFTHEGVDRYGLAGKRPEALIDLPKFNGDQLIPERSGGDISIQACADDPQVAFHAVRQLINMANGMATLRWMQAGFLSGSRNLMGFKDGTNNPSVRDAGLMDTHVWVGKEGGWMQGGSYQVVRRIRIALEHWDKTKLGFQEEVVGRHKISGAPLGKKNEHDVMDLNATDAEGNPVIPETAHARVASPQQNDGAQMLRRGYSYNDGASFYAERWPPWRQGILYDAGLFFAAYQRDPRTSFVRVNQALAMQDMMNQYTTHVGSGIFACPPGAKEGSYIGAPLFAL